MFRSKFDNQKTVATIIKELLSMKMKKKEKVQDFNQKVHYYFKQFWWYDETN